MLNLKYFHTPQKFINQNIKETISKNFDASVKDQENKYDILVATDAISEGFNLHRAGTIFNLTYHTIQQGWCKIWKNKSN